MIAYQHLKPGTQIFGHLIGEFDSFILIWQIKNKNKIRPTYPFFSEKTMGNKIFFYGALSIEELNSILNIICTE